MHMYVCMHACVYVQIYTYLHPHLRTHMTQERLRRHIEEHPSFIQPAAARNEILQRLQKPLRDLCVSRSSFSWGVPLPPAALAVLRPAAGAAGTAGAAGEGHVMYVWFDALSNYLSGSINALAAAAGAENVSVCVRV